MLKETLQNHLKEAMRARDEVRLRTVRSLRAALLDREIELRTGGDAQLTEEQEMSVVQKQAKQRRDAMQQFSDAGRDDLARREEEELQVLDAYLPQQLSDDELKSLVREAVTEVGADSMRDMGRVMGGVMPRVKGRADGKRVQAAVRTLLGG